MVSFISTVTLQIRCREVATSVARAIERGESDQIWRSFAESALPEASIRVRTDGGVQIITVQARSSLNIDVSGEAVALP